MPRIALIVPARFASSRFPGKPLAALRGPDGGERPLLDWTWDVATAVTGIAEAVVATDDDRIATFAQARGMPVVMTPASCANGTERCAAALPRLAARPDIVVNLQGDAPLTPPSMVTAVVERLVGDDRLAMATAAVAATGETLAHLRADAAAGRVGGTTVVCNAAGQALYFSKSLIPHGSPGGSSIAPVLIHIGLYAYRPAALDQYVAHGATPLEQQEGLEQLRFLEAGLTVGVAVCPAPPWAMVELNNCADRPVIEAQLPRRQLKATA